MLDQSSYIKQLSQNKFIQDKFDSYAEFILERDSYSEKLIDDYRQSILEMRESLLKEYFDYKGIDYKRIELQCRNMNNFKLKDGLFHKISYSDEKGAHYYFKGEFIMSEECGVFYLGEWYV
ncbi:hypothetical protein [Pseudoalteromonas phage PH357]|nr:hypothetical protein [Pseudoalteromonas phage PH357]